MKNKNYILLFLLFAILLPSCLKEKLSDCEPGVYITYYYEHNKLYKNTFENEVDRLEVYVYDNNNNFYKKFIFTDTKKLTNDHQINLPLPQGIWEIRTWGGYMNDYNIVNNNLLYIKEDSDLSNGEYLINRT